YPLDANEPLGGTSAMPNTWAWSCKRLDDCSETTSRTIWIGVSGCRQSALPVLGFHKQRAHVTNTPAVPSILSAKRRAVCHSFAGTPTSSITRIVIPRNSLSLACATACSRLTWTSTSTSLARLFVDIPAPPVHGRSLACLGISRFRRLTVGNLFKL